MFVRKNGVVSAEIAQSRASGGASEGFSEAIRLELDRNGTVGLNSTATMQRFKGRGEGTH